ncbi:MAG: redoxin domain-containing protein [Gemmatales bacterium]
MNRIWRGIVFGLFLNMLGVSAWADDPPKKDDPPAKKDDAVQTPAEKFAAAKKANDEANVAFNKVIAELQKKKEKLSLENKDLNEAYQVRNKTTQALVKAAEELAKAEPTSPAGLEALNAVISFGNPSPAIIKLLTEHHAASPKVGQIIGRFYYSRETSDLAALMNKIIEVNPSRDIQANAMMTLARMKMESKPEEAEKLFETIMEKYKDLPKFDTGLGKRAGGNLFELRNLQIGKVVPEIEGEDVDGKKFKISDYRGKVVMLDFWGHW